MQLEEVHERIQGDRAAECVALKIHLAPRIMRNAHSNNASLKVFGILSPLWNLARVPILGLLLLLAPVVESVCCALLLLGLLISAAFKISGMGFPFWPMITLSFGFGLFVILYHAVIGILSR